MGLTLIATAGATNANSYCTVAEADAYHNYHPYASVWDAAEADQKVQLLVLATRIFDTECDWIGLIASQTQALRWPRVSAWDFDNRLLDPSTLPTLLRDATAELARWCLAKDRYQTIDDALGGIKSVKAGEVAVEFDRIDRINLIPASVLALVRPLLVFTSSGSFEVPLVRV
jgi:hypothetical protein